MSDDFLEVRVMDWIIDSPLEQRAHFQTMNSFSKIRRLEIRLTGWTINQTKRIHVGVNSVPTIICSVIDNAFVEAMSIDLECLAKEPALITFCRLISASYNIETYSSIQKLTISCSGEEDISYQRLQTLGKALASPRSIFNLQLVGMNSSHLSTILGTMGKTASRASCCLPCPSRILNGHNRNSYNAVETIESVELVGYPKLLGLRGITLSNEALFELVHLLQGDNECAITNLTLKECVQSSEDLDLMGMILEGRTILKKMSIVDYTFRERRTTRQWWQLPPKRAASIFPGPQKLKRLRSLQLVDCNGQRKTLEAIAKYTARNDGTEELYVENSYAIAMASTMLSVLRKTTVVDDIPLRLQKLSLKAHSGLSLSCFQALADILSHRNCNIQYLALYASPSYANLDVLGGGLMINTGLTHLSLQSNRLEVGELAHLVAKLNAAPIIKKLDLLGVTWRNEDISRIVKIFETNTTLEQTRIRDGNEEALSISYFGLRNTIRHLLLAQGFWTPGTWKEVLNLLLGWKENQTAVSEMEVQRIELVFLSGIWFALTDCPQLANEMVSVV